MLYEEIGPTLPLARYVKCFWSMQFDAPPHGHEPETILPDGSIEIVFNLADKFHRFHVNGTVELQPSTIVVGQMRQFVKIQPTGRVDLFGIRFHTAGAYHFFRCSLRELTGRIVEPDTILDDSFRRLEQQIQETPSTIGRVALIEKLLLGSLRHPASSEMVVEAVKSHIAVNNGVVSIPETARHFGVSQRQLQRHFLDMVGVSPKFYSRVIRLQSIIAASRKTDSIDLLGLALRYGYYDQSHFIRDFTEFSGKSPTAFMREESKIGDAFIGS